jgi:hypothetical protein
MDPRAGLDDVEKRKFLTLPGLEPRLLGRLARNQLLYRLRYFFLIFLICVVGGGIKVHSTLRPLNGLLCQPRVIMITEKSVE